MAATTIPIIQAMQEIQEISVLDKDISTECGQ